MIEITSTPLIILAILGTVGISLPLISIARKDMIVQLLFEFPVRL